MSEAAADGKAYAEQLKAKRAEEFKQAQAAAQQAKAPNGKVVTLEWPKRPVPKIVEMSRAAREAHHARMAPKEIEKKAKEEAEKKTPGAKVAIPSSAAPNFALRWTAFNDCRTALEKAIAAFRTLGVPFSYDLFRDRLRVGDHTLQQRIGESIEYAILVLRSTVVERFGFDPRAEVSKSAVVRLCLEKAFDPVLDYLTRVEWDKKPRLDTWLVRYLGATDDPLNRAIGRKVLIAAVRRVRVPGTKFDQVMVLEGKGGTGKSTAIKILAGDFFCDQEILKAHGREVQELCTGVWLYEISELAGLGEANVERVKAFVSRTHDKARPAYGTVTVERGRRCVFIGTCNRDDYLIDETGNRRFWCVATTTIDLDALRRDRDQLWAEAVVAEAMGETLVIDETLWGVAAERAEARLAHDPWEDAVSVVENLPVVPGEVWRSENEIRVRSDYIFSTFLKLGPAGAGVKEGKRLAAIMKRLGWNGPKVMKIDGVNKRTYWKPITKEARPIAPGEPSTFETILKEKL